MADDVESSAGEVIVGYSDGTEPERKNGEGQSAQLTLFPPSSVD